MYQYIKHWKQQVNSQFFGNFVVYYMDYCLINFAFKYVNYKKYSSLTI